MSNFMITSPVGVKLIQLDGGTDARFIVNFPKLPNIPQKGNKVQLWYIHPLQKVTTNRLLCAGSSVMPQNYFTMGLQLFESELYRLFHNVLNTCNPLVH